MKKILSILLASSLATIPGAMSASAKGDDCPIGALSGLLGNTDGIYDSIKDCIPEGLTDCLDKLGAVLDCIPGLDGGINKPEEDTSPDDTLPEIPEVDIPDINIPDINIPDIEIPDIELPEDTLPDEEITDENYSAQVLEVVALVNKYRAQHGLSKLTYDSSIMNAADTRAIEQETLFSHTRPNGTSCFTALDEAGSSYRGAGENIAMGQRSAEAVMEAWMNSEGHRANILGSSFTKIGVGFHIGADGTYYWSQFFTY